MKGQKKTAADYYKKHPDSLIPLFEDELRKAGGDISYIPDSNSTKEYYGLTFTTGFGTPGLELHANWSYGGTLPYSSINIFDVANDYYQTIMEW